ncbi:MAG: glycosyltransferase 87 family protein, partial [Anaerolineales bacterium]
MKSANKIGNQRSFMKIFINRLIIFIKPIPYVDILIVLVGILLALALRYSLRSFASQDYSYYNKSWYETIKELGFPALGQNFSNYTPPFLYMLYVVSKLLPNIATVTAVKLPAILCDFICAWFVYRIVRVKYEEGPIPIFAFLAILFAPTVILNSAVWGQADSIFTAALVAFVFYVIKKQPWLACIAFGIAFSIKLQSIYLAPLLLVLFLKRVVSWKHLLAIPAVYIILIIPAWIAGRPLMELLTVYFYQVQGVPGLFHNAPNMYTWLPADDYGTFFWAGIIFAVSICLIYVAVVLKSRVNLSKHLIVQLAFVSALLVPYFLPKTHDRYFYLSDIFSIVYAFYFPEYFYIALAANLISFFTYQP